MGKRRRSGRSESGRLSWAALLVRAVREPGLVLSAYRAFPEYSMGNQVAAYAQVVGRGLPVGPLGTYRQWLERGRQVRKGERALWLCVPRKARAPPKVTAGSEADAEEQRERVVFCWIPAWFVLSQTDGAVFVMPNVPSWERDRALDRLGVRLVPFEGMNGNVQGYTVGRSVAVNPLAALPLKTLFHELGHVLLHTGDVAQDEPGNHSRGSLKTEASF